MTEVLLDQAQVHPGLEQVGGVGMAQRVNRHRALADAGVQALLEVFPAEIRDVEEM